MTTIGAVVGGLIPADTTVTVTGRANSHSYITALNTDAVDGRFTLIDDVTGVDVVLSAAAYAAYHEVVAPIIGDGGRIDLAAVTVTGRVSRFSQPQPYIVATTIVPATGAPGRRMQIHPRLRASAVWQITRRDPHDLHRPQRGTMLFAATVTDVCFYSSARRAMVCGIVGVEDGVTAEVFVPDDVYAASGSRLVVGASVIFSVRYERDEDRSTLTAMQVIEHPAGARPGSLMPPLGGNRADDKAAIARLLNDLDLSPDGGNHDGS